MSKRPVGFYYIVYKGVNTIGYYDGYGNTPWFVITHGQGEWKGERRIDKIGEMIDLNISITSPIKPLPERKAGYYWTKTSSFQSEWDISYYNGTEWFDFCKDQPVEESSYQLIGSKVQVPKDPQNLNSGQIEMRESDMNEYQHLAMETAIYPESGKLFYPVLGLVGEAGELANKVKKILRDEKIPLDKMALSLSDENRQSLISELGDCLWYIAAIASDMGMTLGEVSARNLTKLAERKKNQTLQGSGDDR